MNSESLWRMSLAPVLLALSAQPIAQGQTPHTPPADQAHAGPAGSTLDVPLYPEVTIDGDDDDWHNRGRAEVELQSLPLVALDPADLSATMRMGWDERGLLLLVVVNDDIAAEGHNQATLSDMDCVEIMVSDESAGGNRLRFVVAPGQTEEQPQPRVRTWDYRQDTELRRTPVHLEVASQRTPTGYRIEALIPWEALGVIPRAGAELGFSLVVHDADEGHRRDRVHWGQIDNRLLDSDKPQLNRIRLTPMHHNLAVNRNLANAA